MQYANDMHIFRSLSMRCLKQYMQYEPLQTFIIQVVSLNLISSIYIALTAFIYGQLPRKQMFMASFCHENDDVDLSRC